MRYTLSELLENKKLRVSVAKIADKKELDFEDGNRRKLGEQKKVIQLIDEGSGKLTVEYVERLSGGVSDYKDGDYYEEWYNMYNVTTRKVALNY